MDRLFGCFGKRSKNYVVEADQRRQTHDSQRSGSVPDAPAAKKKGPKIPWWRRLFGRLRGKKFGKVAPAAEEETPQEQNNSPPDQVEQVTSTEDNNDPPAEPKTEIISTVKPVNFTSLGFPNPANFCYINSSLQSLLTLEDFVTAISSQEQVWSLLPEAELMRLFMDIKASHFSSDLTHKFILTIKFKEAASVWSPEFEDFEQKDAHEFLISVLDQIRSLGVELRVMAATMDMSYRCPVEDQLLFKMQKTRTCKSCGEESIRQEEFTNLSLDLLPEGGTVMGMLEDYQKEEKLEYRCECGGTTSGQRSAFVNLPKVLVLHLKRFKYTDNFELQKVHCPVFLCRDLVVSSQQGGCCLSLVSIISHVGSGTEEGHYISHGLDLDVGPIDSNDRWFTYNDAQVTETTGASVSGLNSAGLEVRGSTPGCDKVGMVSPCLIFYRSEMAHQHTHQRMDEDHLHQRKDEDHLQQRKDEDHLQERMDEDHLQQRKDEEPVR
ncbi:ubiquitin carboxyl-terminal hydrolase 12-like [Chelmon rostratus]|uniref:ubiquitin carboxyl-terminal hydrolase 12-like n=1 Tax=Chelmon rostratus TaxID=109905 RepID=UPI001BE56AC5|nr:ubiquitin carboxyl-terminal hydrolase 12-like [Chelmon rostratus]